MASLAPEQGHGVTEALVFCPTNRRERPLPSARASCSHLNNNQQWAFASEEVEFKAPYANITGFNNKALCFVIICGNFLGAGADLLTRGGRFGEGQFRFLVTPSQLPDLSHLSAGFALSVQEPRGLRVGLVSGLSTSSRLTQ